MPFLPGPMPGLPIPRYLENVLRRGSVSGFASEVFSCFITSFSHLIDYEGVIHWMHLPFPQRI